MFLLKTADENVKRSEFIIRRKFGVNTVITVCGLLPMEKTKHNHKKM